MKVTKQQLKQIIEEELSQAVQEGELDEGFLDKLLGRGDSKFGEFVTSDEIQSLILKIQKDLGKLAGAAARQGNKQLYLKASDMSKHVDSLRTLSTPKGTGEMPNPADFTGDPRRTSALDRGGTLARRAKLGEDELE